MAFAILPGGDKGKGRVDAGESRAYIPFPMKRFVLALLALLGLIAQGAPVQAGLCGSGIAQVGTVSGTRVQGQALAAQSLPAEAAAKPVRKDSDCRQPLSDRKRPVYIPSVQLGSDRAHE